MASSFDYLKKEFPLLAKLDILAESYCKTDSNGALYKIRKKGGFKRIDKDFKFQLHALIAELNKYLYDDAA